MVLLAFDLLWVQRCKSDGVQHKTIDIIGYEA